MPRVFVLPSASESLVVDLLAEWLPRRRLGEIDARLDELRVEMGRRPLSDPMPHLVTEHRDLVRERNKILNEGSGRA